MQAERHLAVKQPQRKQLCLTKVDEEKEHVSWELKWNDNPHDTIASAPKVKGECTHYRGQYMTPRALSYRWKKT